jgi:hypothetical protein
MPLSLSVPFYSGIEDKLGKTAKGNPVNREIRNLSLDNSSLLYSSLADQISNAFSRELRRPLISPLSVL